MECVDFVEIFGGVGSITRGMTEYGYRACNFDIRVDPSHNIHTEAGIMTLARMISSVTPAKPRSKHSGSVLVQPTCSSWGWVNRGTSVRNVDSWMSFAGFPVYTNPMT